MYLTYFASSGVSLPFAFYKVLYDVYKGTDSALSFTSVSSICLRIHVHMPSAVVNKWFTELSG